MTRRHHAHIGAQAVAAARHNGRPSISPFHGLRVCTPTTAEGVSGNYPRDAGRIQHPVTSRVRNPPLKPAASVLRDKFAGNLYTPILGVEHLVRIAVNVARVLGHISLGSPQTRCDGGR